MKKYFRVWWKMTANAFSSDLSNRFAALLLLTGKIIRFLFFLGFLFLLIGRTKSLAGYSLSQVVFFFLTFNLLDVGSQLFLRGVYYFRFLIISGNFDFTLAQPINPLFRSLTAHTDALDFITLFPLLGYFIFFLINGGLKITTMGIFLYLLLLFNSCLIAVSLHIIVLAIGILTTEVDHLIWIYRDFSSMGRIPIDIYQEGVRIFLTFVVPIGVLMTFPAKALMGLLSWEWVIYSFLLAWVLLFLSLRFWDFALKRYSSASS